MDPATTEIYTYLHTLSLHDALPIFVRGVVDSDDLTLNVSRELLQSSRQVERIRGALTKRVLDLLERIAGEDNEKYGVFWQAFGNVLKRSEEHTSELPSLMRISYAVFCLKNKTKAT